MDSVEKLVQAVMEGEEDAAAEAAEEIVAQKLDLHEVIGRLTETMGVLGKQFESLEIFLPEMIIAADALTAAMGVFNPVLAASGDKVNKGKVVLGSAPGDVHEIGKNIVKTLLIGDGFDVVDLGKNVEILEFVKRAQEVKADIIGVSALMSTTMPGAADIINLLKDLGIREQFKVMVGGAPTNADWAERIGADGWAPNSTEAVALANRLAGGN
jgi:methanogenic corrinoid protein MtbC1